MLKKSDLMCRILCRDKDREDCDKVLPKIQKFIAENGIIDTLSGLESKFGF